MADALAPDVLIIGGGPGGYTAAIRAAQLGLATACVEKEPTLGGVCVNVGCIPSKALLESSHHFEFARLQAAEHGVRIGAVELDLDTMLRRKDSVVAANTRGVEYLFRKHGIAWVKGTASLLPGNKVAVRSAEESTTTFTPRNVIIATGSEPITLPFLPFDEARVLSNIGVLRLNQVPPRLLVIGGGVIGLELGSVWRRLGSAVTVVELLPAILPGTDAEIVREAEKAFRKQGMTILTGTRVTGARVLADRVRVDVVAGGEQKELEAEVVLVAVGRRASLGGLDAEGLGLGLGSRGEIVVDGQMRTNLPNVFAIGDVVGGALLAHKAEEEGIVAVEVIAGQPARMHYRSIPSVVYTWPEIATVGATEDQLREEGRQFRVGRFPFSANGRARTAGEATGFIKILADAATDELLGAHLIGPTVSELVSEIVLAFEFGGSSEDIGITVHAHPTLSEATKEAALSVLGRSLNI